MTIMEQKRGSQKKVKGIKFKFQEKKGPKGDRLAWWIVFVMRTRAHMTFCAGLYLILRPWPKLPGLDGGSRSQHSLRIIRVAPAPARTPLVE